MADYRLLENGDYRLLEDGTSKRLLETSNTICWGHDTAVTEDTTHDFNLKWTGTGYVAGVGDNEKLYLNTGENMESEAWNIGNRRIKITTDKYQAGAGIFNVKYKDGATEAACEADSWHNYTVPFVCSGWVKIRIDK